MMYLLDTNILLDYLNGIGSTVSMANRLFSLISTSVIVKGELFHGVYMSARIDDNERLVTELLGTINLISIDENTAVVYAKLKTEYMTVLVQEIELKDVISKLNFSALRITIFGLHPLLFNTG
jgi:predicted nucleic acid-binding protein